jgi:hypothetical protein
MGGRVEMTFNEIQYWRARADRFRTELLLAYASLDNGADREDVKEQILEALSEAPPAMADAKLAKARGE